MSGEDNHATTSANRKQGTSALEWYVAAIGGLLFLLMVSYMVMEGLVASKSPAQIQIIVSAPVRQGNAFAIRFDATNTGGLTASRIVVRATLYQGDREVETADATIDYLAGRSTASGGFWFSNDPARFKLETRAVSYVDP